MTEITIGSIKRDDPIKQTDLIEIKDLGSSLPGAPKTWLATLRPGGGSDGMTHEDEYEILHVLQGGIEFKNEFMSVMLNAGDYVHIPPGTFHAYKALYPEGMTDPAPDQLVRLLATFAPA